METAMLAGGIFLCLMGLATLGIVAWQVATGCRWQYAQWQVRAARYRFAKYSERYIWGLAYANIAVAVVMGLFLIVGGVACILVAVDR